MELAKQSNTRRKIAFTLEKKAPRLTTTAPEFVPSGGTQSYNVLRPTEADRRSVENYRRYASTYDSTSPSKTQPPPTPRAMETPPAPTTPTGNSEWFNFMREERAASDRRLMQMVERMSLGRAPSEGINKAVPQVQPMSKTEDLREFFQLYESTQQSRRTPREAYAATLLPLLNPTCKSLAFSLPTDTRTSYSHLKRELLAQADSRADATIQQFWEHRKPKTSTWREEAAVLNKLARRCAPSDDPEQVRQVFVMEQLTQQLPRNIQQYVRDREPSTTNEVLHKILTYFRARGLEEEAWESKEDFTAEKNARPMTSPPHGSANSTRTTSTSTKTESSTPSGSNAARHDNSYKDGSRTTSN